MGRAAELAALTARLEAALAGEPGAVLLAGEPGIGKTRLASELERLAGARAVPVLWGGCSEDRGAPTYWPWRRIVRSWRASGGEVPASLAALDGPPPPHAAAGPAERFALFDAVGGFLAAAAAPAGLVLVLDDLQWADPDAVALLAHVAREPGARLLLIGTCRPAELRTPLNAVPGTRLDLRGLAEDEVARLTGDAAAAAGLTARTGGNPFFVTALGTAPGSVPGSVRDVVARRVARLPADCRQALGWVAVAGRECDAGLVAGLAGQLGSGPPADPFAVLAPALAEGVLLRTGSRVRFPHDLVREALLLDLPDRSAIHAALARTLAPRAADPDVLPELAGHALAALPSGDRDTALRWARDAGELALRTLAHAEAARLLGRVLDERADPPAERLALLLRTAEVLGWSHAIGAASERAVEAAALARKLGDVEGLARAALVLPAVSEFEWLRLSGPWAAEALAALPEADSALRARLLAQHAHAHALAGDTAVMDRISAEALAMAERLDDPRALADALRARQLARAGPDGNAERLELGTRLLTLADRTGDPDDALWGRLWRFDALLQAGRVDEAEAEVERLAPLVARLRRPLAEVHLLRCRIAPLFGRGRWAELHALNREVEELGVEGGHEGVRLTAMAVRYLVAVQTGDDEADRADLLAIAAAASAPQALLIQANIALWYVTDGRRDLAVPWYRRIPPTGSPRIPNYSSLVVEACRAVVATELGDRAAAEACYLWLRPHADLHLVGGAGAITTSGSMQFAAGVAAIGAGRSEEAVRHLRRAVEINAAARLDPFTAAAQARLAEELRRRDHRADRAEAEELARAALATARLLGLKPLLARLEQTGSGPLSAREAEIAAFVAQGLTNRQIAAAAHISERTVETHVQHILAKLGFSGRSQIAAWVARGHR
ncbi:Predicted ATPase [Pseudonocardia oroxyli]|uniref:Predicted ATPase n=1 Tax=Pseudonocardia oroxyli TaxID=366584 RepID=A0A1G7N6I6_PSEOR|nr:Predicted ATPase [Pseudonocardia oroxyli]